MNAIAKATRMIETDPGLQIIFVILLCLLILLTFYFLRRLVNEASIKSSEGHGLGFFCKNTGQVFPINQKNTHIEAVLKEKHGRPREIFVKCVCGETHGFDIYAKSTAMSRQNKIKKILGREFGQGG